MANVQTLINAEGDQVLVVDGDKLKINSRDYTETSGDIVGFQARPAVAGTGTVTAYGGQISPRVADTIAAANLIGLSVEPILKGTSGNISGDVRGLQASVTDGGAGRTISGDVAVVRIWNQLESTVTGDVCGIRFDDADGGTDYTCAMKFSADVGLAGGTGGASLPASTRWIEVDIAGTKGKIAVYDD